MTDKKNAETIRREVDSALYHGTSKVDGTFRGKTAAQLAAFVGVPVEAVDLVLADNGDADPVLVRDDADRPEFESKVEFVHRVKAIEIENDEAAILEAISQDAIDKIAEARKSVIRQSIGAAESTFERFEKTLDDLEELRDETRRNLETMKTDLDSPAWDIRDYLSNLTDAIDKAVTDLG